jgi:hypothetical protein
MQASYVSSSATHQYEFEEKKKVISVCSILCGEDNGQMADLVEKSFDQRLQADHFHRL